MLAWLGRRLFPWAARANDMSDHIASNVSYLDQSEAVKARFVALGARRGAGGQRTWQGV